MESYWKAIKEICKYTERDTVFEQHGIEDVANEFGEDPETVRKDVGWLRG